MTKVILAALSATLLLSTASSTFAASKKRPAFNPAATASVRVSPEAYNARAEVRRATPARQRTSQPAYFTYATGGDNG
jgi:hypothetical protein